MRAVSRELVLWLLERGHQPVHLRPSSADPLTAALEEAIVLRDQGRSDVSLELLQQLEAGGISSPWILDNKARALHVQGQTALALELWRDLQSHPDAGAASTAQAMVEQLQRQLLDGLLHHCRFHSWTPRHLPSADQGLSDDLLQAALEEAIATREANKSGLSLALMEEALQQGWQSPWLHDNRARALVNLGRVEEALQEWQRLTESKDAAAAAMAQEALLQQREQRQLAVLKTHAEEFLSQQRAPEAEALLLPAWIKHPEDSALLQLLERAITAQHAASGTDLLDQELAEVNRQLWVHERLQSHLEQRLAAC